MHTPKLFDHETKYLVFNIFYACFSVTTLFLAKYIINYILCLFVVIEFEITSFELKLVVFGSPFKRWPAVLEKTVFSIREGIKLYS